ncbi:sigma factor [Modestobacter sp. URMC 112]
MLADEDLVEDVLQEVFLSVWRHPGAFDPARGRAAAAPGPAPAGASPLSRGARGQRCTGEAERCTGLLPV